jgi:hypothetical protein
MERPTNEYERLDLPMEGTGRPTELEQAVTANAESLKGFAPRFVARCLGLPIPVVLNMCKRQTALGRLERYEVNGEYFWRQSPIGNGGRES